MSIYKPYAIDAARCSIVPHQIYHVNNGSNCYNMHHIQLLTTRMNLSKQSAQQYGSLYFVGITTTYSWAWGCNTHCWVFWHHLENVNFAFPAGSHSCNWRIWFGGVQEKYITWKEGIHPCKVSSWSCSSPCIYWTKMLWASGMIPWLVFIYSTSQSSPRQSTEIGLWSGWW